MMITQLVPHSVNSQTLKQVLEKRNEVYFKVPLNKLNEVREFSIDNIKDGFVYVYATSRDYSLLTNIEHEIEILIPPSEKYPAKMAKNLKDLKSWDSYPTYDQYIDMMYQFESTYPDICKIYDIGESIQGRKILFAKISDNVSEDEVEPEFMYSSSIHGDELVGYVLMLRLIDYLLNQYDSIDQVQRLTNSLEIWINPLANPDGTYANGDTTVFGSRRTNASYIDLNRNFPDPEDGPNPDNHDRQQENIVMIDFVASRQFIHSANFHGGATVLNYPWDTWAKLHADDEWYKMICRQYADTVHKFAPAYMTDFNDGITNGYQWYTISGGRQDYMNYYRHCREITIELGTKLPQAINLPSYWDYNRQSLLNYIEQSTFGIYGLVTDLETGLPVSARVSILSHDTDNSEVLCDSLTGYYHRVIKGGAYDMLFSADGYESKIIYDVNVSDFTQTNLNVSLDKKPFITEFVKIYIQPDPHQNRIIFNIQLPAGAETNIEFFDMAGRNIGSINPGFIESGAHSFEYDSSKFKNGYYIFRFQAGDYISYGWLLKS